MTYRRILNLFFEYPDKKFHIRQISRELNISKTTVGYHINNLVEEGILRKDLEDVFVGYRASNSELYRIKKLASFLEKLELSGILKKIEENKPSFIILGEKYTNSTYKMGDEVVLYTNTDIKKIKLDEFEKNLDKNIIIKYFNNISQLKSNEIKEVINGFKLRGGFEL